MDRRRQLDALRGLLWQLTNKQRKKLLKEAKRACAHPGSPQQVLKECAFCHRGA